MLSRISNFMLKSAYKGWWQGAKRKICTIHIRTFQGFCENSRHIGGSDVYWNDFFEAGIYRIQYYYGVHSGGAFDIFVYKGVYL